VKKRGGSMTNNSARCPFCGAYGYVDEIWGWVEYGCGTIESITDENVTSRHIDCRVNELEKLVAKMLGRITTIEQDVIDISKWNSLL